MIYVFAIQYRTSFRLCYKKSFSTEVRVSNSYRKRSKVAVFPNNHQKFPQDTDSLCKRCWGAGERGVQEHPFQPSATGLPWLHRPSTLFSGSDLCSVNVLIQVISISPCFTIFSYSMGKVMSQQAW